MKAHRILIGSLAVAALIGVTACGDDDDDGQSTTVGSASPTDGGGSAEAGMPTPDTAAAIVVGKSEADAEAAVVAEGWVFRVIERDGEMLAGTMDFRPERVNVAVEDGTVTGVVSIG